jgi:hypothetical protein
MNDLENLVLPFAEIAGPMLAVAALLLVVLFMRNPHRPQWMHGQAVDQTVAFALVLVIALAIGLEMSGLFEAGYGASAVAGITGGAIASAATLIWYGFDFTARLRNADAGVSPFRSPRRPAAVIPPQSEPQS